MTDVMLKTSALQDWAKVLLYERIPANVADPKAMEKAATLAREFVETHPWALAQGAEFDLDELSKAALEFARAKGYDLLDEPVLREYPVRAGIAGLSQPGRD